MSEPADLLIVGGRAFVAYRPTDLVPYGSDVGPRPVGAGPWRAHHGRLRRRPHSRPRDPAGGWLPSEKLSLPDALAAYGRGSAYVAFADDRRGTLRLGADADLVVLDRDILAGGPSSIIGTTWPSRVVGGQVVHRSEAVS